MLCVTCLLLGFAGTLPTPSGSADAVSPESRTAALQHRLAQLRAREDARYAKGALEQARRALQIASSPAIGPGAVSRARQIADAALVLADRQLARHEAQTKLFATQRRLSATRERANAQRRALEALMRDRASLAREGERP